MYNLRDFTVAIMGGDAREVTLAGKLAAAGATVKTLGVPAGGGGIISCLQPEECLAGAHALILPVPGVKENMRLHSLYLGDPPKITGELLSILPPRAPVLVGMAREPLRRLVEVSGLRLVELMQVDEVAVLNSIPSAEGAVQMAMEKMPVTIHGCIALVLGFGRTAQTLAQLLLAMHAGTTVAARDPAQLARAEAMGLRTVYISELMNCLQQPDVIFNTVPAPVITENVLSRLTPSTLIIDLASAPGGTDFATARKLGIDAVLAPGLPGKVAPRSAGLLLARVIPRILLQMVNR
ncbi:MAG: dipicolinate synthase subunit DpsA [Firmicutes bacterium]|nr:dipicolinate synthase subunit DpsA [Bacillota bacterium]